MPGFGNNGVRGVSSCCQLPWWRPQLWSLAAAEDLDDPHWSAAAGAWLAQGERDGFGTGLLFWLRRFGTEQTPGSGDVFLAARVGEQAVVADAVEPVRQDMEQEAANELAGLGS